MALEAGEDFAAMGDAEGDTGGDTGGDTDGGIGTVSVGTGLGAAAGFAGATGVVDPVGGIDFLEDGVFGFTGMLLSD